MKNILLADNFFKDDLPVYAFFGVESREKNMHSHDFWELSYVYEGQGTHFMGVSSLPIGEKEFAFISPYAEHCIVSPPKKNEALVRVCNVLVKKTYMDKIIDKYKGIDEFVDYDLTKMLCKEFCIQLSDDSRIVHNQIMAITHEYNHYSEGSDRIIENCMINLLIYISRLYKIQTAKQKTTDNKNEDLDELIKYIRSNYGRNLSLELLAEHAHMSREYLSRKFKSYTGTNISDFIAEIRIERAKQLLRSSTHSIMDISSYCGYTSLGNFQKFFKKLTGCNPSEYRKKHSRLI